MNILNEYFKRIFLKYIFIKFICKIFLVTRIYLQNEVFK